MKLTKSNSPNGVGHKDYQLLLEYRSLKSYSPQGVYIVSQLQNNRIWHGVIFIRSGDYKGSIFKFQINIPVNYPETRPEVYFTSPVFHPLVDPESGYLNINPKFKHWRPKKDFIFLLLWYLKSVFLSKEHWYEEYVLNSTAWSVYTQDESFFQREAKICAAVSNQDLTENDPENPMKFSLYNAFHKKILKRLRSINPTLSEQERCEAFMQWFRNTFS